MSELIDIEVVYALPEKQKLVALKIAKGSSVEQGIVHSAILNTFPEIDLSQNKVGIWSRTVPLTEILQAGDRIEIYRPLIADPKDMRKRRAEKAKEEGRADAVTGGRPQTGHKQSSEALE